jgi:RNA polymerase sigma factor (sigma-70 family)
MCENESLSDVLKNLQRGDIQAFEEIWGKTKERIRKEARRKLDQLGVHVAASEDIVDEVFVSLWAGAKKGRYPRLDATQDLWQVVRMLIRQKVIDWRRRQRPEYTESALGQAAADSSHLPGMGNVGDDAIPPEVIVDIADCLKHFLDTLEEDRRMMAVLHLDGLTHREIAAQMGVSLTSVDRKLPIIEARMRRAFEGSNDSRPS